MEYASFGFVLRSPMAAHKADGLSPNPYRFFFSKGYFNNWRYKKIDKNNRTEILNFRVSKDEKRIIEDKAFIKYDTLAPYLRDCALNKEILVLTGLSDIQDELNAIGNNLNQLTRAVNMGQADVIDLSATRKEVASVWQLLNSSLQKYLLV